MIVIGKLHYLRGRSRFYSCSKSRINSFFFVILHVHPSVAGRRPAWPVDRHQRNRGVRGRISSFWPGFCLTSRIFPPLAKCEAAAKAITPVFASGLHTGCGKATHSRRQSSSTPSTTTLASLDDWFTAACIGESNKQQDAAKQVYDEYPIPKFFHFLFMINNRLIRLSALSLSGLFICQNH